MKQDTEPSVPHQPAAHAVEAASTLNDHKPNRPHQTGTQTHSAKSGDNGEAHTRTQVEKSFGSESMSEEHVAPVVHTPHSTHSGTRVPPVEPAPPAPPAPPAQGALPQLSPDDREADEIAARRAGQIVENIIQIQQVHRGAFIPTQVKPAHGGQGGGKDRGRNRRHGRDRERGPGQGQNQGQGQNNHGQNHGKDRDRNRGAQQQNANPKQNFAQPRHDRAPNRQGPRHAQNMNPSNVHNVLPNAAQAQPYAARPIHAAAPVQPAVAGAPAAPHADRTITGRHDAHAFPSADARSKEPVKSIAGTEALPIALPGHSDPAIPAAAMPETIASAIELSSLGAEAHAQHREPLVTEEAPHSPEASIQAPPDEAETEEGDSNYAESMADESAGIYEETTPTATDLAPIESVPEAAIVENAEPVQLDRAGDVGADEQDGDATASTELSGQPGALVKTGSQQNRQQRSSRNWRESTYESSTVAPQIAPPAVRKVVLLNSTEPGEIRVAILENGELAEIFMERKSHNQQAGNIYKGRVVNVEPSLQAAFIDLGAERNGFLHASDVIPPNGGYPDVLDKKIPEKGRQRQHDVPRDNPRPQRDNRDSNPNREPREKGATPPSVLAAQQAPRGPMYGHHTQPFNAPQGSTPSANLADGPLLLNRPARPSYRSNDQRPPAHARSAPAAIQTASLSNAPAAHAAALGSVPNAQTGVDIDPPMPIVPGQPSAVPSSIAAGVQGEIPVDPNQSRDSKRRRRRRGGRGRANRARVPGQCPCSRRKAKTLCPLTPSQRQVPRKSPHPQWTAMRRFKARVTTPHRTPQLPRQPMPPTMLRTRPRRTLR